MSWKTLFPLWRKQVVAIVLFIIAYILIIPFRDYEFLARFTDISKGVSIWAHLIIILSAGIFLTIVLKIMSVVSKHYK